MRILSAIGLGRRGHGKERSPHEELSSTEKITNILENRERALQTLSWQASKNLMIECAYAIDTFHNESPILLFTKEELAKIGIHDPAGLHPSWQQHGFEAEIDWDEPNTPSILREFFKPTKIKSRLKITARADTHDHNYVWVPITAEGKRDYSQAEETDDFVSRFTLIIRDDDKRIEIFVKQRFEEESLAGGLPRDFFGLQVKFLESLPSNAQKVNLKDPRNFSCEPEGELTRDQALIVTQLTLFALRQSNHLHEPQQEVG